MEPTDPNKLARTDGPDTSREAAEGHVNSGDNVAQKQLILAAVRRTPGGTVDEIAEAVGMLQHKVGKRLPDLEKDGLVRKGEPRPGRISRRNMTTWWPAGEAEVDTDKINAGERTADTEGTPAGERRSDSDESCAGDR